MQQQYRVTGAHKVAGVPPGGRVALDPDTVNVAALVAAGHVEPAPPAAHEREAGDPARPGRERKGGR